MKSPFILVAIPFKNETKLLVDLVYSILKSYISGFTYYMVCFDDGSSNEELDFLYNSIPKIVTIVKGDNLGYTQRAHDIIEYAKNQPNVDYLLLLNSDVKFETGTFFSLVKRVLSNPNIAAVGGKILEYDSNRILHTGTRLENEVIIDPYCGLDRNDSKTNFAERRLWVNGCATLYNLDILRKENLNFDLDFCPSYFEEADLMTKLNLLGYSVMYEPRAIIHHLMNASHNKEREKYEKVFWENWDKYLTRWKPKFNNKQLQF